MNRSFKEFRDSLLGTLLDVLWAQWTALGVSGTGAAEQSRIVDPESLLLLTLTVGRYDSRLFDEVLDWLTVNGEFINIQRLKNISIQHGFQGMAQLGAVSEFLGPRARSALKWKNVSAKTAEERQEPLFCLRDGSLEPYGGKASPEFQKHGLLRNVVELRGQSMPFPSTGIPSLLMRLRALVGLSARCEILCVLGASIEVHPSEVARQTGYFDRTVQNAMLEMARSGVVSVRTERRRKMYWLNPGVLDELLRPGGKPTPWTNWSSLFRAVEMLWLGVDSLNRPGLDAITVSSEFRRITGEIRPLLGEAGLGTILQNEHAWPGEQYAAVFMDDIAGLLDAAFLVHDQK